MTPLSNRIAKLEAAKGSGKRIIFVTAGEDIPQADVDAAVRAAAGDIRASDLVVFVTKYENSTMPPVVNYVRDLAA